MISAGERQLEEKLEAALRGRSERTKMFWELFKRAPSNYKSSIVRGVEEGLNEEDIWGNSSPDNISSVGKSMIEKENCNGPGKVTTIGGKNGSGGRSCGPHPQGWRTDDIIDELFRRAGRERGIRAETDFSTISDEAFAEALKHPMLDFN